MKGGGSWRVVLTFARAAPFVELTLRNNLISGLKSAQKQLQQFGQNARAAGMLMAKVGISVLTPFALSVKRFADFDDKMREVKAVAELSDEGLARLTKTAKELGATTSFTAVEVAGLMGELGRAGFNATEIEAMTAAVLNLSRATSTDATMSAGIMAATLRQFGMEASQAGRVADVLTVAANKSFTSVEDLGEALSYAGPVAADFGMSIEDTAAVLGVLGNVGIQGSNAGTALRRMLTLTAAEGKKMEGIFGTKFIDSAGNIRPLVDSLADVTEATKDMPTAERGAKFYEAFGMLGITSASAIGKNAVSLRDLRDALGQAEGAAAKTAAEMDAGIGGSFRRLLASVEGIALAIGESLEAPITNAARAFTGFAKVVIATINDNKAFVATVAAIGLGILAAGGALLTIGTIAGVASFAIGGFFAILAAIKFALVIGPLLLIGGLLLAHAALWASYSGAASSAFTKIKEMLAPLLATFTQTWDGIKVAMAAGDFAAAGAIAMAGLKLAILQGIGPLAGIFSQIFEGDFAGAFDSAVAGMASLWHNFVAGLIGAFASVPAFISDSILSLAKKFPKLSEAVLGVNMLDEQIRSDKIRRKRIEGQERKVATARMQADNLQRAKDMGWAPESMGGVVPTDEEIAAATAKADALAAELAAMKAVKPTDVTADAQALAREQLKGTTDELARRAAQRALDAEKKLPSNEAAVAKAQAELDALTEKSKATSGEAELRAMSKMIPFTGPLDELAKLGAGGLEGLGGGAVAGTFSAAQAVALGRGGGPMQRVATAAEKQNKLLEDVRELTEKEVAALEKNAGGVFA